MHEMGIASSILEAVRKEQRRYPGCRPVRVAVRIGEFSGVSTDSLQFCFEAIVRDTPEEALELSLEPAGGDELDIAWLELDDDAEKPSVDQREVTV